MAEQQARPTRAFRPPIVAAEVVGTEAAQVSFGDLVRMLAESIADAQASLDRASAELVAELAATRVKVVPQISETIDATGGVSYKAADPVEMSLLEIGVTPTFYQFSQATVEVSMDVKIVESEESTQKEKRFGLFAQTRDLRVERKFNRNASATSKLTATLVPVPSPLRIEPTRRTTTET